jgi:hypothetical protein
LLHLVVPLRDFVTSILDVRKKVEDERKAKEKIQKDFQEHLQEAIVTDTFESHDFQDLIERGADPTRKLESMYSRRILSDIHLTTSTDTFQFVTLLQFAAYKGNESLVQYLLSKGVKDEEGKQRYLHLDNLHSDCRSGGAFQAAAWHNKFGTAQLLAKSRSDADRAGKLG